MDDSILLSSRSAAQEALYNLNATHTRLQALAAAMVDRLFPGDGLTRDESIVPFVNLAFIAVTKARTDLETYAKSFEGVLRSIDASRAATAAATAAATPTVTPVAAPLELSSPKDSAVQSESVGMLKRKYEEGLAASAAAAAAANAPTAAPKKAPMGAVKRPAMAPAPAGAKQAAPAPASDASSPATATPTQAAPATTPSPSTSSANLTAAAPAPEKALPVAQKSGEDALESSSSMSETPVSPRSMTASSATSAGTPQSKPQDKEAMKKALEGMVLPARKKATPIPISNPSSPAPGAMAPGTAAPSAKDGVSPAGGAASGASGSATSGAQTGSSELSESGGGSEKKSSSAKKAKSDTAAAGTTSDDEVSSDEEEYLRGVEERRLKALAEKELRLKAAKEAREARQTMYAFLNEEPPPGFVSSKPTTPAGKKTKKEKKDKSRDKSSKGRDPSADGEKRATGSPATSLQGSSATLSHKDSGRSHTIASSSNNNNGGSSELDLSSSSTSSNNTTPSPAAIAVDRLTGSKSDLTGSHSKDPSPARHTPRTNKDSSSSSGLRRKTSSGTTENVWTTRYRPMASVDTSTWKKAEESIMKDPPPTKKRWEEYQAKYAAKMEATTKAGKEEKERKHSTAGLVKPLPIKTNSQRKVSHGADLPIIDSPRRKSNVDEDSIVRRKSNAEDSSETKAPDSPSASRKPPPKLETIDDPRVHLFEAPVTEANLRYMEKNGEECIAGGTIEKLIQVLTSASDPSTEYFQCFMLTYHNFLTPQELIELLRLRWNSQPGDPSKLEMFVAKDLLPIRLRIVNVLRMWIENFSSDFKGDESVVASLNSFIDYIRIDNPQMADLVALKLKRLLDGYIFDTDAELDETPPPTHPITEGKESNPTLIDIHPEEFARQMSLVEHALFKAIPYKELLTNAKAGKTNPNISNMISYTNHIVNWVGTQIVKQEDIKVRAVHLARFITIAKYCIISCQNYNGAMEIVSALRSSPVFRLKHTWNLLPDSIWDDYEWLENIFESDNNYAAYRKALNNAVPPCVPYLGRYLSEILFLNEIHPDYLTHGPPPIINFAKMTLVAEVLYHLQRYQKSPFCLTGAPIIQKFFLLKRGVQNEKELYKISLEREPREASSVASS